jgi:hypothetical protein
MFIFAMPEIELLPPALQLTKEFWVKINLNLLVSSQWVTGGKSMAKVSFEIEAVVLKV